MTNTWLAIFTALVLSILANVITGMSGNSYSLLAIACVSISAICLGVYVYKKWKCEETIKTQIDSKKISQDKKDERAETDAQRKDRIETDVYRKRFSQMLPLSLTMFVLLMASILFVTADRYKNRKDSEKMVNDMNDIKTTLRNLEGQFRNFVSDTNNIKMKISSEPNFVEATLSKKPASNEQTTYSLSKVDNNMPLNSH